MRLRIVTACLTALWMTASLAATPHYEQAGSISMKDGSWDYAAVDPINHTLFIARIDGVTSIGLDPPHATRGFDQVKHGHAVVPIDDGGILAVTSGGEDALKLFDTRDGKLLATIPVGHGPDGAIVDALSGDVLVTNGHGGTISVVDPKTRSVVRSITLQEGLEFPALDRRGTLYVNNEDLNQIDVVDPATGKVSAPIALTGCTGPSGLAYDEASDRLIAACDNGKAAVVDASTHHLVKLLDIGRGPDAVVVDAKRRYAFIPCGQDGTLAVIGLDGADAPRVIETVKTEVGARTGALDPATGTVYLPTARFAPQGKQEKHAPIIPGSVHVLMVRPIP